MAFVQCGFAACSLLYSDGPYARPRGAHQAGGPAGPSCKLGACRSSLQACACMCARFAARCVHKGCTHRPLTHSWVRATHYLSPQGMSEGARARDAPPGEQPASRARMRAWLHAACKYAVPTGASPPATHCPSTCVLATQPGAPSGPAPKVSRPPLQLHACACACCVAVQHVCMLSNTGAAAPARARHITRRITESRGPQNKAKAASDWPVAVHRCVGGDPRERLPTRREAAADTATPTQGAPACHCSPLLAAQHAALTLSTLATAWPNLGGGERPRMQSPPAARPGPE